ncbi:hypothetical protein [Streptomyces sp. NPDC058228]|uniref:hypothetical protein n=1 Tax=Streptomyces sp. NPDC058228 TaxID=3346390 RepID=UPI0036ECF421
MWDSMSDRCGAVLVIGWGQLVFDVKQLLIAAFGEDFVRYVLNIAESESLDAIEERAPHSVLNTLSSLALQSVHTGFIDVNIISAGQLAAYMPDAGTSLVQVLRKKCGGSATEKVSETGDPVLCSLFEIARDIWPVYLMSPPRIAKGAGFFMANPGGVVQHPKKSEAARRFMVDPSLSKLFPPRGDGEQKAPQLFMESAEWVVNVGSSGTRQIVGVLSGLIFDARLRVALKGQTLTYKRLTESLVHSLATLRSLADGKVVDVPAVIGLSGINVADDHSIRFTDGVLRGARPEERSLLLNGSGSPGAVYETTYPVRILSVDRTEPRDPDWGKSFRKYRARIEESARSFEYSLDKVRLALLLCSDEGALLAPKEESRLIVDPVNMGGSNYWFTSEHTPANSELPADKHLEVIAMYDVIRKKHPESLNIAMKRLLSAVSSRWDSNDALIDALIAWENMFGTRTETTFRVTASLAKILEGETERRLELQRELNKLYSVRSSMVHGAKEPDPDTAARNRERVIRVAVDGLRALYHERPELLALPPEERSKKVLLEG